ncbi:uncharacterized protein LOC121503690 [Cheilinus undulatus]|uniref:uncharacterized protein LOC121503690 n=1 Tax=Cheilinus undulatus TaxID=241271 RepID=UPI001BD522B0|nr:uncharacterized protein LOC121503690 [Cheilinus undulatus]
MDLTISESLFNTVAESLYNEGALRQAKLVTNASAKTIFKTLQFFRQPLGLTKTLFIEVGLSEAPNFNIRQQDGITVNARARVRVFTVKTSNKIRASKKQKNLLSVSAMFRVAAEVAIQGQHLTLLSHQVLCTIVTKNKFRDALAKNLNYFLTSKVEELICGRFTKDLQIPLPEVVNFTQGQINYYDGFVTVRGCLDVTPAAAKKVKKKFEEIMKKV